MRGGDWREKAGSIHREIRVRVMRTVITEEGRVKQEGAKERTQGTGAPTRKETEGRQHSDWTGREGKGCLSSPICLPGTVSGTAIKL